MYLIDYHTHSELSPDSSAILLENAQAAMAAGLSELCITDHFDLLDSHGRRLHTLDWAPRLEQYHAVRAATADKLTLRLGVEFGSGHVDAADTAAVLAQPELDFVIGSLHNSSPRHGGVDFYYINYTSPQRCYEMLDDYFSSIEHLVEADCYDVLGHIIYPLRYMRERDGQSVHIDRYWDQIRSILKGVVAHGRGIEMNTWRGQTIEDWRPILSLFRDCGGEYLTVGSDAHESNSIGRGVREAYTLLQDMGFRYITTYEKRKPTQIKL